MRATPATNSAQSAPAPTTADRVHRDLGLGASAWGVLVVAAGAALSIAYAVFAASRPVVALGIGLAMAWGLGWIAYGRANGPLVGDAVAVAAGIAAGIALLAPVVTTVRARRG
ncbi:hypothetical protein [Oerskovia turbata]